MDALTALKGLKDKLKKEAQEVSGNKKYVRKIEHEEARLQKIREEEAREREEKERKRKQSQVQIDQPAPKLARVDSQALESPTVLKKEEITRRLRALGQPAILFGEDDFNRMKRLRRTEMDLNVNVEDELRATGQFGNSLLELQRNRDKKQQGITEADKLQPAPEKVAPEQQTTELAETKAEDPTMAAFKRAAAALAAQREEEQMSLDDKIAKWLRQWSKEWEDDMNSRPEEIKNSASGAHATLTFKQTMKYMEPLYDRLKNQLVPDELRTGIWMMVQAMKDRNYMHANDVYLKLAIGTAPWPIGVTSVGIHDRSAREKISHVMNAQGQAHIMNDEATRKFLQAIKRMITQLQRLYPTDPSRSVDFSTMSDLGKGMRGGGSDRLALIEAEAQGTGWKALGLPEAPHFVDRDGSVRVPEKWAHMLAKQTAKNESSERAREKSPAVK